MSNGHEFYQEEEVDEILRIAAKSPLSGGMSRERLMATAAELGISEQAVLEAEEQMRGQRREEIEKREFEKHELHELASALISYVSVNLFLVGIWYFTGRHYFWPIWPILGWGFAIVNDVVETFVPSERKKQFEKWQKKRRRSANRPETAAGEILAEFVANGGEARLMAVKELHEKLGINPVEAKTLVDEWAEDHPGVFQS